MSTPPEVGLSSLEFSLLGPVSASLDARPIKIGPPQRRAVLAVLLLSLRRAVSIDSLADAIWGPKPPSSAAAAIHVHVHHLRRQLEAQAGQAELAPSLVTYSGAGSTMQLQSTTSYMIDAEPGCVDVTRFRSSTARAEAHWRAEEWQKAVLCFDQAISLWRGEALADLNTSKFIKRNRVTLKELWLTAQKKRASALLKIGLTSQVIDHLHELFSSYPSDESLLLLLTTALYRMNETGRATQLLTSELNRWEHEFGLRPRALLEQRHKIIEGSLDESRLHTIIGI
jgi:SARP family transcriptional regulator, regulator of embCAB operon